SLMQENIEDLPDKLSDKYVVSFISRRLSRNYTEDEFLESINNLDDFAEIDNISVELEQIFISEENRERGGSRGIPYHKGYVTLP
ncbi:4709_t:CDS:2, partial [Scutellospora calospora]